MTDVPRAILWDLGGVLVDVDFERAGAVWTALTGNSWAGFEEHMFASGLKARFDAGEVTLEHVADALALDPKQFAALWSTVVRPRPERLAVARAWARSLWTGVMSNTDPVHMTVMRPPMEDFTRTWILSYEVGALKPDPAIYRAALNAVPFPAAQVVFFDDRPENVAAACHLGIRAHLYSGRDTVESVLGAPP